MKLFTFLADCATEGGGDQTLLIVGIVVIMLLFLGMSVLPQRRRQKNLREMSARIKVGDHVKTAGGICGIIVDSSDADFTYTILSGDTRFVIDRNFVYSMEMMGIPPKSAADSALLETEDAEGDAQVEVIQGEASDNAAADAALAAPADAVQAVSEAPAMPTAPEMPFAAYESEQAPAAKPAPKKRAPAKPKDETKTKAESDNDKE